MFVSHFDFFQRMQFFNKRYANALENNAICSDIILAMETTVQTTDIGWKTRTLAIASTNFRCAWHDIS